MEDKNPVLEDIEQAVKRYDISGIDTLIKQALDKKIDEKEIRDSLISAVEFVRKKLMSNKMSIPEFLLSIDTMFMGLDIISRESEGLAEEKGSIVIGLVEGDPHDLGKNIISRVYQAYGYKVLDLGREVSKDAFVKAVEKTKADILALSAMMSTTMIEMEGIIQEVKVKYPGTVVMVGGAPLDREIARRYGADGYADSALTVIEETEAALNNARQ